MTVSVPEDRIADKVNDRLKELVRTVKIDGFRPGKVPFGVVQKRFGPRVREEVMGEVLRTSFSEALTAEELRPVGEPSIEPGNIEPGNGMSYTATFEVYPAIEIAPVEALKIEKPVCEIVDADLEKMIETLRDQRTATRSRSISKGKSTAKSLRAARRRISNSCWESGT